MRDISMPRIVEGHIYDTEMAELVATVARCQLTSPRRVVRAEC